jgi:hypothetical protein
MSRIKEQFNREINEPSLKFVDDVYKYLHYQKQQDELLKNKPLSDCCDANVNFIQVNDEDIFICNACKSFCKIH